MPGPEFSMEVIRKQGRRWVSSQAYSPVEATKCKHAMRAQCEKCSYAGSTASLEAQRAAWRWEETWWESNYKKLNKRESWVRGVNGKKENGRVRELGKRQMADSIRSLDSILRGWGWGEGGKGSLRILMWDINPGIQLAAKWPRQSILTSLSAKKWIIITASYVRIVKYNFAFCTFFSITA